MTHPIPVFYDPRQSTAAANSFSPSAGKPALVMKDWLTNPDIASAIEVKPFQPANRTLLYAAHDRAYVDGVLDCEIKNGFNNTSPEVAASLPYTVGSMVAAALHVLTNECMKGLNVAVSPTSGFHHAGHAWGGGYCTFNGLIATAVAMKNLGLVKRVLIMDFDQHYGNGTQNIINKLKLNWITHITAEQNYDDADSCLAATGTLLRHDNRHYDLVLYQAGADIHVDDPLGGILTTVQMKDRDQSVLQNCIMRDTPIVWNLAGGYQRDANDSIEPVLALHRQTMLTCLKLWEDS